MLTQPKQITVKAVRAFMVDGRTVKIGSFATYGATLAAELISSGKAVAHHEPEKPADAKPAEAKTAKAKE